MASDAQFVAYVCDRLGGAGTVSSRKMFGEYAIYLDGKVVALVCDNRLYIKPTAAGRALAPDVEQAPPYPGARPHLAIDAGLDDRPWLEALARATAHELPAPRPPKARARRAGESR